MSKFKRGDRVSFIPFVSTIRSTGTVIETIHYDDPKLVTRVVIADDRGGQRYAPEKNIALLSDVKAER